MKKYSFLWVTGLVFLVSLVGHWWFGWLTFQSEQAAHGQAVNWPDYFNEMMRDTLENWQSEFLQLMWQVAALAFLYFAGSPQSRGDDERIEAKLDALLAKVDPDAARTLIPELDRRYPGR
jgi:lysylphosphatidylglycerol synthetase-like protein (DUF2156 family)